MFDSLSKKGRKLKDRLRGKKHKPDKTGANTPGEIAGSSGSLLRPEPRIVAGGRDGEGNRTSTDVQRDLSRNQSTQQEPMPAGGDDTQQRGEADVDEKEVSQNHSRPGLDVEVVVGSGASREVERVHSSPSTEEPDSTRTFSFHLLYLIILPDNADTSTIPDRTSEADVRSNKSTKSNAAANENKRNWKSTAYETAKLLLRGVNDSADIFPPLKSVTASLCFILDNCEVLSSPAYAITALTGDPANEGKRTNDRGIGTPGQSTR